MRKKRTLYFSIILFFLGNHLLAQNSTQLVQRFINQSALEKQMTLEDIANYRITNSHFSKKSGINHTYIQQQYHGIPIYNSVMGIHTQSNGDLLMMDNQFQKNIIYKINTITPSFTSFEALQAVAKQMHYGEIQNHKIAKNVAGAKQEVRLEVPRIAAREVLIYLTYFPVCENEIRLCWNVNIEELDHANWWDIQVDALTGKILNKTNWTVHCDFRKDKETCESFHCSHSEKEDKTGFKKQAQKSNNPDSYKVFPVPIESPNHGARQIVANPADPIASPFAWHDDDGIAGAEYTYTRGNNVYAQEDMDGFNTTFGTAPDGTVSLDFDFPYVPTDPPSDFQDAAITNLFYWTNIMHDVWYHYGFDEASGNFQQNNYGNGGLGTDFLIADAQDGSGLDNAFFSTPTDGGSPRMQMFLWSNTNEISVNSPSLIAGTYNGVMAQFGAMTFTLSADLVLADDASSNPTFACAPLVNSTAINGNIALIDRGTCEFGAKALNAENAGAIAAIICNNVPGGAGGMLPGLDGANVTIPVMMLSQEDCTTIKSQNPNVHINFTSNTMQTPDGDFDNGIITHEYGHGISNRLTGGAGNVNCLGNVEQMGEGWSDWFALMMTIEASDFGTDTRGIGTYVLGHSSLGRGNRSFPYSTDMSICPFTYHDIITEGAPHGVGSVWCSMLWDMTWQLINQYGFDADLYTGTGGNNIAMSLVIEAMKLQPCSPGFVDARDAILAADYAMYGGANSCLIWQAFADRGLGINANQGSSTSKTDGNENFEMPSSCACLLNQNLTSSVPSGIYQVQQTIQSTGTISSTSNVEYLGNCIELNPNFEVKLGAEFSAEINPCF